MILVANIVHYMSHHPAFPGKKKVLSMASRIAEDGLLTSGQVNQLFPAGTENFWQEFNKSESHQKIILEHASACAGT